MVQRFPPKGKGSEASGAVPIYTYNNDPKPPLYEPRAREDRIGSLLLLFEQYDITDFLFLDRNSNPAKAFAVTEVQTSPQEVDPHEFLGASGFPTQVKGTPGAWAHASSRKRKILHRSSSSSSSISSPSKRLKPSQCDQALTDASDEEDSISDAETELDGVLDDEKSNVERTFEVSHLQDEFFPTAFKSIGQLGCKHIVKAWIRTCHPKKQTTHPYNGGESKRKSLRLHGFAGALTTPDYWPSHLGWRKGEGCRHKEPDHIKKPERLILLVHLLCCGHPKFTLEKMRLGTAQIEREIPIHFTPKSIKLLKRVYEARALQIRYENNEIDGDTKFSAYMPQPPAKVQSAPKSRASVPIKNEQLQCRPANHASTRTPNAAVGDNATVKREDNLAAQMDLDSDDRTELTLHKTPISEASSRICDSIGAPIHQPKIGSLGDNVRMQQSSNPSHHQSNSRPSYMLAMPPQSLDRQASGTRSSESPIGHESHTGLEQRLTTHKKAAGSKAVTTCGEKRTSSFEAASIESDLTWQQGDNMNDPQNGHLYTLDAPNNRQHLHDTSNLPPRAHGLPLHPFAPKPKTFSGSSSGLAGLPMDNSWPTTGENWEFGQNSMNDPGLTNSSDPAAYLSLLPSYTPGINSSFGSEYTDSSFGNELQPNPWSQPSLTGYQQDLNANFQQQYLTSLPSGLNALALDPKVQRNDCILYPPELPMRSENKYISHMQCPRQW